MADYVAFHPKGTSKSLYKAIIDIHYGEAASAYLHIDKAQKLSCEELQEQLAMETLSKTEVLVELQEAIQYKTWPHLRDRILRCWVSRFKRSHADANTWLKRLRVWMLASEPTNPKLQGCMMDCAKLCEGSGMREAAAMIIKWATPEVYPPVGPGNCSEALKRPALTSRVATSSTHDCVLSE
jgi:FKBP12-rapamycin complex-associated protein